MTCGLWAWGITDYSISPFDECLCVVLQFSHDLRCNVAMLQGAVRQLWVGFRCNGLPGVGASQVAGGATARGGHTGNVDGLGAETWGSADEETYIQPSWQTGEGVH